MKTGLEGGRGEGSRKRRNTSRHSDETSAIGDPKAAIPSQRPHYTGRSAHCGGLRPRAGSTPSEVGFSCITTRATKRAHVLPRIQAVVPREEAILRACLPKHALRAPFGRVTTPLFFVGPCQAYQRNFRVLQKETKTARLKIIDQCHNATRDRPDIPQSRQATP